MFPLLTACGDAGAAADGSTGSHASGETGETGEPTSTGDAATTAASSTHAPTTDAPATTGSESDTTTAPGTTTETPDTTTDDPGTTGATTGDVAACDVPAIDLTHDAAPNKAALFHVLDNKQYPDAVCNDGTPATYVLRKGAGAASKRWVIYIEGGGACAGDTDCAARFKQSKGLMSSQGITAGDPFPTELEGIKSIDPAVNPDFHDATYVQLNYCSSDAWSGDTAGDPDLPNTDVKHWHFRGRKIVAAAIADLQAQGLADAEEVFLMGSSAGGLGTLVHTDDVHAALAPATRFVAMIDAGFFIDYPSYDPMTEMESTDDPTERYLQLQQSAATWGGRGDASCEAQAGDDAALLACRSAVDLLVGGHISAPMFVRQSQLDAVQLKNFIPANLKTDPAKAYRGRFADALRGHLEDLAPAVGVFSTLDAEHGIVNNDAEWSAAVVDGTSVTEAIGLWYRDPCGAGPYKWIVAP